MQKGVDRLKAAAQLRVVGESVEWRDVLHKATQVAATDATVLVRANRAPARNSSPASSMRCPRVAHRPFVAVNCAALPESLLEAELFGYERGAFTGAHQPKPGRLERASGGVLFLDEVTDMPESAQIKLLRVLQERAFQRLGGTDSSTRNPADHRHPSRSRNAVERGDFREDLFYRLSVFDIQVPPLRNRPSDIVSLSEAFLEEMSRSIGRAPAGLTR